MKLLKYHLLLAKLKMSACLQTCMNQTRCANIENDGNLRVFTGKGGAKVRERCLPVEEIAGDGDRKVSRVGREKKRWGILSTFAVKPLPLNENSSTVPGKVCLPLYM